MSGKPIRGLGKVFFPISNRIVINLTSIYRRFLYSTSSIAHKCGDVPFIVLSSSLPTPLSTVSIQYRFHAPSKIFLFVYQDQSHPTPSLLTPISTHFHLPILLFYHFSSSSSFITILPSTINRSVQNRYFSKYKIGVNGVKTNR